MKKKKKATIVWTAEFNTELIIHLISNTKDPTLLIRVTQVRNPDSKNQKVHRISLKLIRKNKQKTHQFNKDCEKESL